MERSAKGSRETTWEYQRRTEQDPDQYQQRLARDQEANQVFDRLRQHVEDAVSRGDRDIGIAEAAQAAGLQLDAGLLDSLGLPRRIATHSFLPWHAWFPWQSLWTFYWSQNDPESPAAKAFLSDRELVSRFAPDGL